MNPTSTNFYRRLAFWRAMSLSCLVCLLWTGQLPAAENQRQASALRLPHNKLRVSDLAVAAQISAARGQLVADYGSFQIFKVDEAAMSEFAGRPGVEDVTEQNLIALNTGALDTTAPEIAALGLPTPSSQGKQLHLVQFGGPIKPEWRQSLEQTGVNVIT